MSEFLAEARILVRPDTSRFRADLETQLASVVRRPITIPVVPVVAPGAFTGAIAGSGAFTAAQNELAAATAISGEALASATTIQRQYAGVVDLSVVATEKLAVAQVQEGDAATQSAAANSGAAAAQARSLSQLERGASRAGLGLIGLNSATLAASGAFIAGAVAVKAFGDAVQSAAQFETELNVFEVTAGATADEMERVSAAAKQLGRDITLPGVTAQSAATAMTELAKAGLSVEDSIAGARGALELATAAQIDVTQSTTLVANALNSFGLAGTDAVKIADLLAGAAKSAQGEISGFGTALGQVASVADQFGVSAADTVTLLTQLAKAGLQGGRAGTTLRVAILGLVKPTAAAAVELDKLKKAGVEVFDPRTGAFNPRVFAQINTALQQYSQEQQSVIRNTIFSSDAIKVLGRATQGGVQDFNNINAAVSKSGLAVEAASARTKGLTGDFENLSNQVGGLSLTVGQLASGPVSVLVEGLADTAEKANLAASGIISVADAVPQLTDAIGKSIPIVGSYVDLLGKLSGFAFNPVETTTSLLGDIGNKAKEAAAGLKQAVTQNLAGLGNNPELKKFLDNLDQFIGAIEKSGPETKDAVEGITKAVHDGLFGITQLTPGGAQAGATGLNPKQIQNIITGFDAKQVRDKIAGDNAQLVADLQAEQAFLIRQLQRDVVRNRPALQRALENALLGVGNDLDAIQNKAKADAKKVGKDAKKNADDVIRALLSAQATAREQAQNAITAAAQTAGLQDDVKAQNALKALVVQQIAAVKARIGVAADQKAALTALDAILIQINGQQKDLINQQRANLEQGISLDISLDQITKNQRKEVLDRNRLITQLNKDLAKEAKLHGKTTVAYKTIRNQIAEQNAAIKSIKGERTDQVDIFKEAAAQFTTFGSNIAPRNGVLSGQDERAAFAKGVLDNVAKQQLTETQTQTRWLERIAANTAPINDVLWKRQTANLSTNPNAGGYKYSSGFAAKMAADNQYG